MQENSLREMGIVTIGFRIVEHLQKQIHALISKGFSPVVLSLDKLLIDQGKIDFAL